MGVCKSKQQQNLTKSSEKSQSQPTSKIQKIQKLSQQQISNQNQDILYNQLIFKLHLIKILNVDLVQCHQLQNQKHLKQQQQTNNHFLTFKLDFLKSIRPYIQSDQVVIYQHNLTGQLARVTILSSLIQDDMTYLNKLKTYQQKCINICQIIEIYKEKQNIYIVQEYCKGGSLKQFIQQESLDYKQILLIMQQMIDALHHIHNQNFTHCHLTMDSFSISEPKNLVVKLSDINPLLTSNYFESITHNSLKYDIALYKSPENDIHPSRDVWSLGAIFYELLTDQRLEVQTIGKIKVNLQIERTDCSEEIKQLIKQMLNSNPKERITLQQIIQSGIFSQKVNSSSLQQCIKNLGKVKKMTYFQSIILYFMMIQFHQEEIQILTQLFNEADKDADNQLDKNELTNLYNVIIPDNPEFVSKQIDQIFLLMDVDNSGFISLNEFITAAANKIDLLNEDYLEACFKQIQNSKGGISIKSLQRKIEFEEVKLKDEFEDLTYDFIYYSQFKELMQQLI